jgi:hypothetical protein
MPEKEKSLEQIQREIAEVDLQTKQLQLAEAKDRNAKFMQAEETRRRGNRQRQAELEQGRRAAQALIDDCRHKSGGSPSNVLRGGGIGSFSIISRSLMPDGVTVFLQCPRCRMKMYFRPLTPPEQKKLMKGDPEKFERWKEGKRLFDLSKDQGLEHADLRGPTFFFQTAEGVPFIPEMV